MHVISRKRLNEFTKKHPSAKAPLARWYRQIKIVDFEDFESLRETFSSADRVGKYTVFNIGSNNIRLIAAIH
jgi:mRNA interferase HigB